MDNLKEFIIKIWAPISGILGAITLVIQFIQLWRGDQETVTLIILIVSGLLVIISLYYVGFSKELKARLITDLHGKPLLKKIYRYGKFSNIARIFFFISILCIPLLWVVSVQHNKSLEEKVVVVIANFDGPDPKNYRVTEQLLSQLSNSLSNYDDTIIIPLGETITEQDGSTKAQALGENYRADLVIWGWYGLTDSDVLLTIHVENLSDIEYLPLMPSTLYGIQLPSHEIKSFQIQQNFSSQISALILFLGGLIRFEANDYQDAINRFSESLNEQWPNDLVSRKFVFFYRGLSFYRLVFENILTFEEGYGKAIDDFSEVIKSDSTFWQAYYFRTMSYSFLLDLSSAEKDYQLYIANAPLPTDPDDYKEYAYLATAVGDDLGAIEYFNKVIENDPKDALSLSNRSQIYAKLNEYKKSLADINLAVMLEPDFWFYYSIRSEIYRQLNEYQLALIDINRAIELHTAKGETDSTAFTFYQRGLIYNGMNEPNKALDDFTVAIQLLPRNSMFYYDRGMTYFELGEFEKAIEDLTVDLQSDYYFLTPDTLYHRGLALEELNYLGDAWIDYSLAAQSYTDLAKSFYDQSYIEHANAMCREAIQNFQDLANISNNDLITTWADIEVKVFQSDCPTTLIEHIPTKNLFVELAINPIIPSSGLAGIKIGDSADTVIEHLGNGLWFRTDVPGVPDCCLAGSWLSNGTVLHIFFSINDTKVVDFYLEGESSSYIPFVNGISLGASKEDLFLIWGDPISSISTETPVGCEIFSYDGIRFRWCSEKNLIDVIEIPGLLLKSSLK